MRLYLRAKREGDEAGMEELMSLLNADDPLLPAERKIILAEKLLLIQPGRWPTFVTDLLKRVFTKHDIPGGFPEEILDVLAPLAQRRGHLSIGDMKIFMDAFKKKPELLLRVAEALLEMKPTIIEDIIAEIDERNWDDRDEMLTSAVMLLLISMTYYFIIVPLFHDPNEKRRKEMRKLRKKIEKQKQRESSNRPRPVVILIKSNLLKQRVIERRGNGEKHS